VESVNEVKKNNGMVFLKRIWDHRIRKRISIHLDFDKKSSYCAASIFTVKIQKTVSYKPFVIS